MQPVTPDLPTTPAARTPGRKDWSREELPIGTVRLRKTDTGGRVRVVKVRLDGPKGRRWIHYARWWWEQHRGTVPAGKRVAHLDGDTLNDDPANYGLLTPGDVVFIAHERNPAMSRRNFARLRAATARRNRETARVRRETSWLPSLWYLVNFDARLVLNEPRRESWQCYAAAGFDVTSSSSRYARSEVLGFPGVPFLGACVLRAIATAGGPVRGRARLHELVRAVRERFGRGDVLRGAISSALSNLGDRVLVERRGPYRSTYRISPTYLRTRAPLPPAIAVVLGADLFGERFAGFTRTDDAALARGAAPDPTRREEASDAAA